MAGLPISRRLPSLRSPIYRCRVAQEEAVRSFETTSTGRLFDTAAAFLGFTRASTFEGQAAIWLEHLARNGRLRSVSFPDQTMPRLPATLESVIRDRLNGRDQTPSLVPSMAVARNLPFGEHPMRSERPRHSRLSGGVFQNDLLLEAIKWPRKPILIWTNAVPAERWRHQSRAGRVGGFPHGGDRMHELSIALSIMDIVDEESSSARMSYEAIHLKSALFRNRQRGPDFGISACGRANHLRGLPLSHRRNSSRGILPQLQGGMCHPIRAMVPLLECGVPVSEILHGRELLVWAMELAQ